ncbi:MAG: alkaline phosphatase family protein [Gammaproteobacteria bacterium]|nr:alkaline phosphatase family protein [Gammaproteobacteria bacterium]
MTDSLVFRSDRPWPNPRLRTGAVVGHATSTSVRLWLRTARPGKFALLLYGWGDSTASAGGKRALGAALSGVPLALEEALRRTAALRHVEFSVRNYEADTTHVLDLDRLEPDTWYGYAVYSQDEERVLFGHNRLRRFRTPPAEAERRPFQFALFSCHMPYRVSGLFRKRTDLANLDMWDFLGASLRRHEDSLDLVIAGGDQCYTDGVPTLDIWKKLNESMRRESGQLLPDEESMLSWYRDIYRGYWGFEGVRRVFDSFPTYMMWDDHEIGDGWGSHWLEDGGPDDGLARMFPSLEDRGLTRDDGRALAHRMFRAASRAYREYQHSHNPESPDGVWDYSFRRGGAAFYVLDGRGQRNIERDSYRILGREQFDRFAGWVADLDPDDTPFVFVVSAVPVLHARSALVGADQRMLLREVGLGDDLRDSWEHRLHDEERAALMRVLFVAAARGIRVSILSGDVHVSAAFVIRDGDGNSIWQLTSSAITYNIPRPLSWILRLGAADEGVTEEGYRFERFALYADSSYALISVHPEDGEAWFRLYGEQKVKAPPDAAGQAAVPLSHSVARIRLF